MNSSLLLIIQLTNSCKETFTNLIGSHNFCHRKLWSLLDYLEYTRACLTSALNWFMSVTVQVNYFLLNNICSWYLYRSLYLKATLQIIRASDFGSMCNLHMDKLFINMYLPVDSDMLLCHKNGIRLECVSGCIYTCTVETRMTKIIKNNCTKWMAFNKNLCSCCKFHSHCKLYLTDVRLVSTVFKQETMVNSKVPIGFLL